MISTSEVFALNLVRLNFFATTNPTAESKINTMPSTTNLKYASWIVDNQQRAAPWSTATNETDMAQTIHPTICTHFELLKIDWIFLPHVDVDTEVLAETASAMASVIVHMSAQSRKMFCAAKRLGFEHVAEFDVMETHVRQMNRHVS